MHILESEWFGVLASRLPVSVCQPIWNFESMLSHSGPTHSGDSHGFLRLFFCYFSCTHSCADQIAV